MRNMFSTAALAALMAGCFTAKAEATEGWYARADVGYSVDGEIDFQNGTTYDLDNDWMAAGGIGYALQNGFRLEGELAYRRNDISDNAADLAATSLMANVFYDFNRGGRFEPYVGAGVGVVDLEFGGAADQVDVDPGLAWQIMAGVAIGLTPQWDLDVGYRYFRGQDLSFAEGPSTGEMDYTHQAVTVGLRYQFAAPAPPPPPPPPPAPPPPPPPPPPVACPTSDFVVYFEWDRSNLNQAALETIDAAVARARECNVSSVLVVGHTDTSGSAQYNMGLSERRASVVRDALVARGIGAGSIQTQAHGEADLARPTRDGVREPLNRRTAVTISFQ